MYKSTIQSLTTIFILFAMVVEGHSQTPLFSFTFDEGLDDWTPIGIASSDASKADSALWVWTPDGNAGTGAFNSGEVGIGSPSGGGAILFDSDGLDNGGDPDTSAAGTGKAPAPQIGEITSPALDFSGETRVILAFYQFYRYFAHDVESDFNTPNTSFEVSGDSGTTWTAFEINADISPNRSTRATDIITQDISDIAAGQASVLVKFIWEGEYYFWLIDDVNFYNERGVDLAITAFTNVNNFETPDFAMNGDTVDLEVMIANHGDADITDTIMAWTRVLEDDLSVVFSDTAYINGLTLSDTIWHDFENWAPEEVAQNGTDENYTVVYNVRIKGDTVAEVVKPDDNVDFQGFLVRDLTLRKVAAGDGIGFTGEVTAGTFEDFTWANLFELPSSFTENLKISKVTFDAFSIDRANDPMAGKSVILYIFKLTPNAILQGDTLLLVEIDGTLDLINFDINGTVDELAADPDIAIGVGSYAFTAQDDADGGPFSADVTDFEGEGPVILEPGNQYLIAVDYIGPANSIAQEVSESFALYQISSMAHYPSLGNGNSFLLLRTSDRNYARNIASIGVELEFISTPVDENPLSENSVKIFPNPASDVMNIDIEFETPTETTIFLADAAGRILMADSKKNLVREQLTYDLTRFPGGTYIVRVATHEGTKTEHIIVTH